MRMFSQFWFALKAPVCLSVGRRWSIVDHFGMDRVTTDSWWICLKCPKQLCCWADGTIQATFTSFLVIEPLNDRIQRSKNYILFKKKKHILTFTAEEDHLKSKKNKLFTCFFFLTLPVRELNPRRVAFASLSEKGNIWIQEMSCRNYSFKLLPLWDFREVIKASDNFCRLKPNKIKNSFPSSSLPINLPFPSFSLILRGFVLNSWLWRKLISDYNCTSRLLTVDGHEYTTYFY